MMPCKDAARCSLSVKSKDNRNRVSEQTCESSDLWFVRVGDNFILNPEPDEQTFRVKKIIKHHQFKPLSHPDGKGDGRNDIALVVLQVITMIWTHFLQKAQLTRK